MARIIQLPNKRDWKWHRDRIATAWGKQVESIIETGQTLIEAKEELDHGAFEAMVQTELPFGPGTARQLRIIAGHKIISNRKHAYALPPSWATIYELTKLPDEILIAGLNDGSIHPKLERKDVRGMRPDAKDKPQTLSRAELVAAIQKDPHANQRDAAKALGVSLGVYQRTRNELIGDVLKIELPPATNDPTERRRAYVAFLKTLPVEEQIAELKKMVFQGELGWGTDEIFEFAYRKTTTITVKR